MFNQIQLSKDELARILETSPEILERFEQSYRLNILPNTPCSRNQPEHPPVAMSDFLERIVDEWVRQKPFILTGTWNIGRRNICVFPDRKEFLKRNLRQFRLEAALNLQEILFVGTHQGIPLQPRYFFTTNT